MTAGIRHATFLKKLQDLPEDGSDWRALSASHGILVLIDRWRDGEAPADLSPALEKLGAALGGMASANPPSQGPVASAAVVRAALASAGSYPIGRDAVADALLRWCESLWREVDLDAAHDVASTALECSPDDPSVVCRTYRAYGVVHRIRGEFAEAERWYEACADYGRANGDLDGIFIGESGIVKVIRARGDLPRAEARLRALLDLIAPANRPDLESLVHHEMGTLVGVRGRLVESLEHLGAASSLCAQPLDRARIVADIAYTTVQLGDYPKARDLFLGLLDGEADSQTRHGARVSLLEIYGMVGDRERVEESRRALETDSLPIETEIDFLVTLGQAYTTLGDVEAARPCLDRAIELAQPARMGRLLILADQAMERLAVIRARQSSRTGSSEAGARDNASITDSAMLRTGRE